MITIITTEPHGYTHKEIVEESSSVAWISYENAFRSNKLNLGCYIFSDLDRLGFWELELAADLYRILRDAGCTVLNNPARVLQRDALLVRLYSAGLNDFAVWRAADGQIPERYPVFLRTISAHRGVLTDLLENPEAAEIALEKAIGDGYPIRDLAFIEYRAQANSDGTFWKHSLYRIGSSYFAGLSVLDNQWAAKLGVKGLAKEEDFLFEYEIIRDNRFADRLKPVFEIASIDYGRADFTVVNNRIVTFEINTNPNVSLPSSHESPIRSRTLKLFRESYLEALSIMESRRAGGRKIPVASPRFLNSFSRYSIRRPLIGP